MEKIKKLFCGDIGPIILGGALLVPAVIFESLAFDVPSLVFYILALIVSGGRVFISAVRGILRRDFLDEKFLMSIASIGAMIVGERSEGVAVMLFFLVGEAFEHAAVRRSRSSIKALMDISPDEATVVSEDGEEVLDTEDVEVGSLIVIRPGERVPLDCEVVLGSTLVDTSAITGESAPRAVFVGDTLASGMIVIDGLIRCKTIATAENSSAQRIIELVSEASESKAKEETFITRFSRYYTPAVVGLAVLIAVLPPLFSLVELGESVYRALIFLVTSCPCALVISVPMAFFGGIGGAAAHGVLFKGGAVFSALASADAVAFDKTGTITKGSLSVDGVISETLGREELLTLAASAEYASNHPAALAVKSAAESYIAPDSAEEYAGEGVVASVSGRSVAVGNERLMSRVGAAVAPGACGVFVAVDGVFSGSITLSDSIKEEALWAIEELRTLGISDIEILSGDSYEAVRRVGDAVGIERVSHSLTPMDKYERTLEISKNRRLVFVGDGINDAPSLKAADVGVAMGDVGQDSAIEAAGLVISADNLKKLPEAIRIARKTVGISKQNIVFALVTKGAILLLGALGLANMWLAVFADVGVAVLAILNSMRALRYSVKSK